MIRTSLGLGLETLGLLSGVARLSRMLAAPVWAWLGDRMPRKLLLFLTTGVWSLWTVAAAFSTSWDQLFWLYTLGALGTVAAEPLVQSMLADLYPDAERGRAFGASRGVAALVLVASTPLVGLLTGTPDGWRWGMGLMGGLGSISGLLILLFVPEPRREQASPEAPKVTWVQIRALARVRTLLLMVPSVMLNTSLVLVSYVVTFLVDVRGLSNAQGTWAMAATALGFVFSSFAGGWLGDRFERWWPRRGRIWLMQGFLLAYAATSFLALQVAWSEVWMTYAAFGLLGLVSAIGYSGCVLPMIARVSPPALRTTVYGVLLSFVQGASTAVLSVAVGYFSVLYGFATVLLWVGSIPYLVNAVLWFGFWKLYPSESSSTRDEM